MKKNKKRIKIISSGLIPTYGHINGPVLTPYYEDISVILKLLTSGVKVVEVADNGSESLLTVSGVLAEDEEVKEEKKVEKPVKKEEVIVKEEEVVHEEPETSDEQVLEDVSPSTNKDYTSEHNYKKNNKHKR